MEGSPGVGKTSLIVALGKFSGHRVVRINLSEQVSSSEFTLSFVLSVSLSSFWFLKPFALSSISIKHVLMQTNIMDLLESDFEFEYSNPVYPNLIQNPMCFRILHLSLNMTEDLKFK